MRWGEAMAAALYGEAGFYTHGEGSRHFRTSANASVELADALLRIVGSVDEALGRPNRLTVLDVGAGRGSLLTHLADRAPADLAGRLDLTAVELAPRPAELPAAIGWTDRQPDPGTLVGVLIATEWLDNVPLDLAEPDSDGVPRYVLEPPAQGLGDELEPADAAWVKQWWAGGRRVELGRTRDEAWADAVGVLRRGLALTVDYGHTVDGRPALGTVTGFRNGRQVPPVLDGSVDITAHVAMDSVRAAGEAVARRPATLLTQREALTRLGVTGTRPSRERATTDPAGYLRALARAGRAAELTDPAGLGGHWWLLQPVDLDWVAR